MNHPLPGWHDAGNDKTVHIPPRGAQGPPPYAGWNPNPNPAPGQPPAGWPGGYGPPPGWPPLPPERGGGRRRLWLALAGVAVVAAVAGTTVFVTRSGDETTHAADPADEATAPSAAPADTPVGVPALSGLLLNPAEAAAVVGSAGMVGNGDLGDKVYEAMSDKPVVDADCMSLSPGLELAYQGSGFTASRQQFLKGESADRKLVQTVVSFADAATAAKYVTATKAKWEGCANRTVNLGMVGGEADYWGVGAVGESGGILSASRVEEGGAGWMCRSGLAARNNIVIDFAVCGEAVPDTVLPAFVEKVNTHIQGAQ